MDVQEDRMTWWNLTKLNMVNNPIQNGTRPYVINLNISNSTGTNNQTHIFGNGLLNKGITGWNFTIDNTTEIPANNVSTLNDGTTIFEVNVTKNGSVQFYISYGVVFIFITIAVPFLVNAVVYVIGLIKQISL